MTRHWFWSVWLAAALAAPLCAHRLDEYLQAALIAIQTDCVRVDMRLVPGVAVAPKVLAMIDTDGNGFLSAGEQRAYAEQLIGDVSLSVDGERLAPRILSLSFPPVAEMKEGVGQIQISMAARIPKQGPEHRLKMENRHAPRISVYLMNSLRPAESATAITAQERNKNQSVYEVTWRAGGEGRSQQTRIGFGSIFRLGLRHIAEGTDHLLFLLTLLLPAPLLAAGGRWAKTAPVKDSLTEILKIVTAFTVGHSCTLALAGMGWIPVPARLIEILIAVSISVSAIHAIRPLFPGREAGIAAFFGLIHGLAFASTITELGLGRWERVLSIFAFNLGIETMQLIVVACALPSLILLSRTGVYAVIRVTGALLSGLAATGWILERAWQVRTPVDLILNQLTLHAGWLAVALFGMACLLWRRSPLVRGGTETQWITITASVPSSK